MLLGSRWATLIGLVSMISIMLREPAWTHTGLNMSLKDANRRQSAQKTLTLTNWSLNAGL